MTTVWMSLGKWGKDEIRYEIEADYYDLEFTLDDIRDSYQFDVTCQGSVPQAIRAFLESDSFEDAIRNAVSIGGDSDTIAAIAGSIAWAYYGADDDIAAMVVDKYLPTPLLKILYKFKQKFF